MCNCYNNILSSTASTTVESSTLRIVPSKALSPENEQGIKILITSSTTTTGVTLPVYIVLNQTAVPVYDKFGNIVYGNQIYKGMVLKGYFGNNGSGNTPHFQLIKLPIRCCGGN